MIPNLWYAILESSQVKPGQPVGVTRMGEKLVLWRDEKGQVTCMSDLCPHRGVALSIGKLVGECVECPFHGFQYDASGRLHAHSSERQERAGAQGVSGQARLSGARGARLYLHLLG